MANQNVLKVRIRDTKDILFEGEADRITSFNEEGTFDVYPMHANFISILSKGLTVYRKKEKIKEIQFDQAIMKIKNDDTRIFVGVEFLLMQDDNETAEPSKK